MGHHCPAISDHGSTKGGVHGKKAKLMRAKAGRKRGRGELSVVGR